MILRCRRGGVSTPSVPELLAFGDSVRTMKNVEFRAEAATVAVERAAAWSRTTLRQLPPLSIGTEKLHAETQAGRSRRATNAETTSFPADTIQHGGETL